MRSDQIGIFKRVLIFEGRGKPEYTEKNLSEKPVTTTIITTTTTTTTTATESFRVQQRK